MNDTYYINEPYNFTPYTSKAFDLYFQGLRLGVLDIETTGLNPSYTKFILGGLLTVQEEGQILEQFFAETPDQEEATLRAYLDAIAPLDMVVTYNGKHFDLPFLQRRAKALGIQLPQPMPYNLDLYLVFNGHSDLRKILPNLKQKTVENFMGLWNERDDEISGAESVELYNRYLRTQDLALREKILLHNSDDVLQLYKLLPGLAKANLHKAMFAMGFPTQKASQSNLFDDKPYLFVNNIELKGGQLRILGDQLTNPRDYISFATAESPYTLAFDSASAQFEACLPVQKHSGLALIDLEPLACDFSPLDKYPTCENNYLVIKNKDTVNYMEVNHFIHLFLRKALEVI